MATQNFYGLANSQAALTFSSVVPLNGITTFPTQTVSGAIAFTLGAGVKSAGGRAIYTLVANGVNTPTFTGFTESAETFGYDNRSGIVNTIIFEWLGSVAWYRIFQQRYALPSLSSIATTFPTRSGPASITQSGDLYYSNAANGTNYGEMLTSAQSIPSGKTGRVTFKCNDLIAGGLSNVSTNENYTSIEYQIFSNGTTAYTAIGGLNGSFTSLSSGITNLSSASGTAGHTYYRMTRVGSSGVVTAEISQNSGSTWTLMRTFAQTFTAQMWFSINLSGGGVNRSIEMISFELEP